MTAVATTCHEVPAFIPVGGVDCFAILTSPTGASNGVTVLLLWGGGRHPTSGRNRIRARMARRLAVGGYHVVRMDYPGVGESTGIYRPVQFDRPQVEDVAAVCDWLSGQGLERIALVGHCFGTRKAVAVAERLPGLEGVALLNGPVRDEDHWERQIQHDSPVRYAARRALQPTTWRRLLGDSELRADVVRGLRRKLGATVGSRRGDTGSAAGDGTASPHLLRPLEHLVKRGVPLLLVYGTADDFYPDFQQALQGRLGSLLEERADGVTVRTIEADYPLQTSARHQEALIDVVEEWFALRRNPDTEAPRVRSR